MSVYICELVCLAFLYTSLIYFNFYLVTYREK